MCRSVRGMLFPSPDTQAALGPVQFGHRRAARYELVLGTGKEPHGVHMTPSLTLSRFLKALTRAHCWQSHIQKSNLIIDALIPWIPSLAAANGWCVNDSIRALIHSL